MRRPSWLHRIAFPLLLALVVGGCGKVSNSPDDSEIVSAIDAKLYQNPDLKALSINVSSNHGVVTLTGTVNAPLEKLAIEDLVMKTAGVKQVMDQLAVAEDQSAQTATASPQAPAMPETTAERGRPAHPRHQKKRRQMAENQAMPSPGQAQDSEATGNPSAQETQPTPPSQDAQPSPPASAPAPPPPQPVSVTIPSGTTISVRMIDSISSQTAQAGQTFAASLMAPVVADDRVAIPQGANAKVRVVEVTSAGHYQGRSELKLELVSISYHGTDYPVATGYYVKQGASRGKNTAEKVGGGAVLGALIGGLIGHGKGAGVGAAIGGAAGTVDQTATHGQQVTVPSETKIDFVLKAPLSVTMNPTN